MRNHTIQELIEEDVVYMGSDGNVYVDCSDAFFWGCADGEDISDETLEEFNQAVDDCGNLINGELLYCSRKRKERPQGAMYTYIPKRLWHLFDLCGPEKKTGLGNPCAPGEYRPDEQVV